MPNKRPREAIDLIIIASAKVRDAALVTAAEACVRAAVTS